MQKITREEAEILVKEQMEHGSKPKGCTNWHYGWCEIRALLDAIYSPSGEESVSMNQQNCPLCDKPTWLVFGELYGVVQVSLKRSPRHVVVMLNPHKCRGESKDAK